MAVAPVPGSFDGARVLGFARVAEGLGFDTIWLSDVPLGPIGDPILSLAAVAAVTERVKLGANVVPLGRNPYVLARQLAQLDRQSGRTVAARRSCPASTSRANGPLWGWRRATGGPRSSTTSTSPGGGGPARPSTARTAARAFEHVTLGITPIQDPLEVWLGGAGPRALARVGRVADGWLTASVTPAEAAAGRDAVMSHAAAAGRSIDPEHFGISVPYARDRIPDETAAALRARRTDGDLTDIVPVGADALRDLLGRHVGAGLSKFVLRPVDAPPDATTRAELGWLAEVVLPAADLTGTGAGQSPQSSSRTAASCSSAPSEWPSTKRSTWGRAAAMPRASGA